AAGWTWLSLASPWSLAMQFALICVSVLGLLSVANLFPFARTDGYYVLTEILDAPNLRRRAWRWLKRLLRGFPATDHRDRGSPWAFWLYGVPSAAFSVWVASRLLLALTRWMAPIMAGIVACAPALAAAGPVRGRVVDQAGHPLAGAIVAAIDPSVDRSVASAASDADGEFVLDVPAQLPPVEVHASAPGTVTAIAAQAVPASMEADIGVIQLMPGRIVEGRVVDDRQRPVQGAEVFVFTTEAAEPLAPGRATTDAEGRFIVTNAPPRARSMAVRAPGFAEAVSIGTRANWILERGGTIEGRVVGEVGVPVGGATVEAGLSRTTTDDQGRFRLEAVAPGDVVVIARTGTGRAGALRLVARNGATLKVDVVLRASAALSGIVTDQTTGRVVVGARLRVYQGSSFTLTGTTAGTIASTDRTGRFTLLGLLPGLYTVEAARLGYNRAVRPELRLTGGSNSTLAVSLPPEARIAGRVVDESGQPIPGAMVTVKHPSALEQLARLMRAGRTHVETAITDTTGRFVIRGLAPGRGLRLEAAAPAFAAARFGGIDLDTGVTRADVVFTLRRGSPVTGLVVDQADRPVVGAAIRYLRLEENTGMPLQVPIQERPPVVAYSDAAGRFVIAGLEAGRYDFGVSAAGYSSVYLRGRQILPAGLGGLPKIVLPPSVSVSGHVLTPTGDPVIGARVTDVDLTTGVRSTTTDASGFFIVQDLSEGQPVSLQFDAPGMSPVNRTLRAPADDLVVQMVPDASLRGRVVHGDTGAPISEFSVERLARVRGQTTLRFGGTAAVQFRSDDGRFEMERLPAGAATIRVRAAGFRPTEISSIVLPSSEEIVVSMKPGVVVEGRLVDATTRRPVSNATVSWREGESADPGEEMMLALGLGDRTTISDGEGHFFLSDLPPSRITLSVHHPEHPSVRRPVDALRERRLEIALGSGTEVNGLVVAEGSGLVAGATVTLTAAGEQASREAPQSTVSDSSGRFQFPHVRPASYALEARAPSGVSPRQTIVVTEADRSVEVTLTMTSGASIEGSVSGLPPERLNHIQVMAHSIGYYDSTFTDSSGHFVLPHVPPGIVSLEATTSFREGASVNATVEIASASSGNVVQVELIFSGQSSVSGAVLRGSRPIAGVLVSFSPQDPAIHTRGRATTDTQGHYEVTGLEDGRYVVLVIGDGVRYQRPIVIAATSALDIDLPLAGLEGRVTSSDGEPIESAVVLAVSGRERTPADVRRVMTDSVGRYQFGDLDAGHYQIRATKVGFEERIGSVSVSDTIAQLDLTLANKPGLRLRFTDAATGAPLSQATVTVAAGDGGIAFQTTLSLDSNGNGQIPALSPGKYVVTSHVTGYAPRSLAVSLPSAGLSIALDHGGSVELQCCGGQPFRRVRLVDAQGLAQLVPSSGLGGWTDIGAPAALWPHVAEGRYLLEVSGGNRVEVTVKAGATTRVELK
ncbi:MAG: carboxypeptidase regulatory-like domain-containing protein, partial [Vicinamibacterales bacterium]